MKNYQKIMEDKDRLRDWGMQTKVQIKHFI